MQIGILASADSWYLGDLRRAAGNRHQILPLSFAQLVGQIQVSGSCNVRAGGTDLALLDAVVVRSMPPGSLEQVVFRMDVLSRAQQAGCPIINPPRALEVAIDEPPYAPPITEQIPVLRRIQDHVPLFVEGHMAPEEMDLLTRALRPEGLALRSASWVREREEV